MATLAMSYPINGLRLGIEVEGEAVGGIRGYNKVLIDRKTFLALSTVNSSIGFI